MSGMFPQGAGGSDPQVMSDADGGWGTAVGNTSQTVDFSSDGGGIDPLQALRGGSSVLSALTTFGQGQSTKFALKSEAYQQRLAASNEYTQANQTSNNLMRQYQQVTGAQLTTAAAEGIDIGSGSVQAAGLRAAQQMDRQVQTVRGTANMNAQLRLARAAALTTQANAAGVLGIISGISKIGTAAAQAFAAGG